MKPFCMPGWRCNLRSCSTCLEMQARRFVESELRRIENEARNRRVERLN